MSIIEKVKDAYKKQKEDLEKVKRANYAKNYYKDYSTAGKGKYLVAVITDEKNYNYISKGSYIDTYDLVASMVTGITGDVVNSSNSLEEISTNYNCIIIVATPTTVNEATTMYIPENLAEFQQIELDNFKRQVDEHNEKYPDKVDLRTIRTGKPTQSDDMSISK